MTYKEAITSFFIENLPKEIQDRFINQVGVALPEKAFPSLVKNFFIPTEQTTTENEVALCNFFGKVANELEQCASGVFIRLGSRSAKDVPYYICPQRVFSVHDIASLLLESQRIKGDILWCWMHDYCPTLYLRPWVDIPQWQEYRCIIKNKCLAGISQYYLYGKPEFYEIKGKIHHMGSALYTFIMDKIIPYSVHSDFICDVVFGDKILLVDYNPLCFMTDLCLFDNKFSQPLGLEFRYIHEGRPAAYRLMEG